MPSQHVLYVGCDTENRGRVFCLGFKDYKTYFDDQVGCIMFKNCEFFLKVQDFNNGEYIQWSIATEIVDRDRDKGLQPAVDAFTASNKPIKMYQGEGREQDLVQPGVPYVTGTAEKFVGYRVNLDESGANRELTKTESSETFYNRGFYDTEEGLNMTLYSVYVFDSKYSSRFSLPNI